MDLARFSAAMRQIRSGDKKRLREVDAKRRVLAALETVIVREFAFSYELLAELARVERWAARSCVHEDPEIASLVWRYRKFSSRKAAMQ